MPIVKAMELDRKSFLIGAGSALLFPADLALARQKPISNLPASNQRRIAWTIDDGVSNSAVKSYLDLAEKHNLHLTLFVTSCYDSWRKNRSQIKHLIGTGQIQLGNHTLSHRDLSVSSDGIVRNQLQVCHDFLLDTYGYDARPYFRPTYGHWTRQVIDVAAELGYTAPMMWYGSLGSGTKTEENTYALAQKWVANGRIVIDHANTRKTDRALEQIVGLIKSRGLKTVTLREAFGPN
ncbi:MAG: polysaccharide deacetylase family protein, partial [Acidobacteria bacterium]|nr:polysaccharide deacetylase family protein [Acidobacteriota bacterium]